MFARHVFPCGVLGAMQVLLVGITAAGPIPSSLPETHTPGASASAGLPERGVAVGPPAAAAPVRESASPLRSDSEALSPAVARLLENTLRASGLDDPAARARSKDKFSRTLAMLKKRVGRSGSAYRKGRRLHDALHRSVFQQYSPLADSLETLLDNGSYNCVSATLFYGIAGRALGLDLRAVETPHHIYLQLRDRDRVVDIETTARLGYDFTGDLERFRRFTWAYEFASHDEIESSPYYRFERVQETRSAPPVPMEQATAFLWHNSAQKALARGDAVRAASYFAEEFKAYPQLAQRLDGFATSLAKAFRIEYEDGHFDSALNIARMDMTAFPNRTSSRDRMLAAATKSIQKACETGEHARAETILEDAEKTLTLAEDRRILETQACPHIIAGAVRAAEWDRAWRMVSRYQAAEPDRVEGERLRAWVLARQDVMQHEAEVSACTNPLSSSDEGHTAAGSHPLNDKHASTPETAKGTAAGSSSGDRR